MTYFDLFLAALRALRANILRSILTTLGIIIGVGAVIIMISVGTGAEARMDEVISRQLSLIFKASDADCGRPDEVPPATKD